MILMISVIFLYIFIVPMNKSGGKGILSAKKTEKCDYHMRSLRPHQQPCAYHSNQLITNFCKNNECLLPVCPTCIKLHTQQHKLHKTSPQYEQISKLIAEIQAGYSKIETQIEQTRLLLADILATKKDNQAKIRAKLVQHRNIMVRKFQAALEQLENRLIGSIINEDQLFINDVEQIESSLTKMESRLLSDRQLLSSDEVLKHIIVQLSKDIQKLYNEQISSLQRRSNTLTRRTTLVTVDDQELSHLAKSVERFIIVEFNQHPL